METLKIVADDKEVTLELAGRTVHIHFDPRGSSRSPADLASRVKTCLEMIGSRELLFALAPMHEIERSSGAYVATVNPMLECAGQLAALMGGVSEMLGSSDKAQALLDDFAAILLEFGDAIARNGAAAKLFLAAHAEFSAACERSGRQALD